MEHYFFGKRINYSSVPNQRHKPIELTYFVGPDMTPGLCYVGKGVKLKNHYNLKLLKILFIMY